jgi:hypothetical protein
MIGMEHLFAPGAHLSKVSGVQAGSLLRYIRLV